MMQSKTSLMMYPAIACAVGSLLLTLTVNNSIAFERYKDDAGAAGSNCSQCHGDFTSTNSPKGTIFPADSKHEMHRGANYMNTDCDLCHSTGDNHNPYTGFSKGTANNPGLGCTGCHEPFGLRRHHVAHGVSFCINGCHGDSSPPSEDTAPPYYGTVDTKANNPCNDVLVSNTNENWSVGDFVGLDNDGDDLYDQADFDCGPAYRLISVVPEGANLRVTWETVGGRKDAIQASAAIPDGFSDVSTAMPIAGVGPIITNYLEVGGATNPMRFYRVRYAP